MQHGVVFAYDRHPSSHILQVIFRLLNKVPNRMYLRIIIIPNDLPGLGISPREGNSNPLQYPCLENPWTEEPAGLQSTGSQRVSMTEQLTILHYQRCMWVSNSLHLHSHFLFFNYYYYYSHHSKCEVVCNGLYLHFSNDLMMLTIKRHFGNSIITKQNLLNFEIS